MLERERITTSTGNRLVFSNPDRTTSLGKTTVEELSALRRDGIAFIMDDGSSVDEILGALESARRRGKSSIRQFQRQHPEVNYSVEGDGKTFDEFFGAPDGVHYRITRPRIDKGFDGRIMIETQSQVPGQRRVFQRGMPIGQRRPK